MATPTTTAARRRSGKPARGFLASALRVDISDRKQVSHLKALRDGLEWQEHAWGYFDSVPEVQNTASTVGALMSRVRLFPAWRPDPSQAPVPLDPDELALDPDVPPEVLQIAQVAKVELGRLESYAGSTAVIMGALGVNFAVPGDAYLLGIPDNLQTSGERWVVASSQELRVDDRKVYLLAHSRDNAPQELPPDTFFLRLWRRHPQWAARAFSPMQSCLDICEELLILTRRIRGQALSGLNAGIFAYADSLSMPDRQQVDGDGQAIDDPLAQDLMTHFSQPIGDPSSPSAAVPFLMRIPVTDQQKVADLVHFMPIDRPFDEHTLRLREEARQRLASGLDLPPEWQQGLGQANHWGAGEIQRQTFDAYIEPLVLVVVDALTRGLLQPALVASGLDPTQAFVWYDPSALFGEGDKFGRALEMHKLDVVSDAYLREAGRAPEDAAPDEEELARRKAARDPFGSLPPAPADVVPIAERPEAPEPNAMTAAFMKGLAAGINGEPVPDEITAAATAALRKLGQRHAAMDLLLRTRVQSAADSAVRRLVEMAGSRLRRRVTSLSTKDRPIPQVTEWKALPVTRLAAEMGRDRIRSFGIEEAALIEDELADLEAQYRTLVDRTQRQAVALAIRELRADLDDEEILAARKDERDEAIAGGWALLADAVRLTALAVLFSPDAQTPPARGEFDPTVHIQAGTIRESLAVAGGARTTASDPNMPVGVTQVATGDTVREILRESFSVVPTGWVWEVGDPAVPFEPHQDLSGVEFARFDDPALSNDESWPPGFYYRPGDHLGCQCSVAPVYGAERETRDEQDSREFAGAFEEA